MFQSRGGSTRRQNSNHASNSYWSLLIALTLSLLIHSPAQGQVTVEGPTITFDTNGDNPGAVDRSPQITTDGAGNWVAVWLSQETSVVFNTISVISSTDNGATWSAPTNLAPDFFSLYERTWDLDITTDSAGNWAVVWASDEDPGFTDDDIFVSSSMDNGSTWSAPAMLNTNGDTDTGVDRVPQISTDGQGRWITVWRSTEDLGGTAGTDIDIFFSTSTDNGSSWSAPSLLNTNGDSDTGDDQIPVITNDNSGNWIVAWISNEDLNGTADTDYDVFLSASTDNGNSWSAPALINNYGDDESEGAFDTQVDITTDGQGTWMAAWSSNQNLFSLAGTDSDILVATSTDNGLTWTNAAVLNANGYTDAGGDGVPAIGTNGAGDWVAAWNSTEHLDNLAGPDFDIFISNSRDNGVTWSSPSLLNPNGFSDDLDFEDTGVVFGTDGDTWIGMWFGGKFNAEQVFLTTFGLTPYLLSVPFYLDNASNFDDNGVPADGTASFIGVKNGTDNPATLTITYTDTNGNDHTPVENTYVLPPNSMVSWRPFANDPVEGGSSGQLVPNTDGGPAWGSVLISSSAPVSGRLIVLDGLQDSMAMMVLPEGNGSLNLTVPFYLDNASNYNGSTIPSDGTASFIGVKNMSNDPVTLTLTYTDTGGNDHTPVENTYVIPPNSMVSWRPSADDPIEGSAGQAVPNATGPAWGSVDIEADGPITGRLISVDGIKNATALMLLPNK